MRFRINYNRAVSQSGSVTIAIDDLNTVEEVDQFLRIVAEKLIATSDEDVKALGRSLLGVIPYGKSFSTKGAETGRYKSKGGPEEPDVL